MALLIVVLLSLGLAGFRNMQRGIQLFRENQGGPLSYAWPALDIAAGVITLWVALVTVYDLVTGMLVFG